MISTKKLPDLRRRAEEILKKSKVEIISDADLYLIIEELNLYQIELELQNEDLIRVQQELQTSHDKYERLYNLAPMAYLTCNQEGLIIDVNQAGLDLLGLQKNRLLKRCFSRYILPEFQLLFSQYRQRALKEKSPQSCELKILKWSGPAFDALLEFQTICDSDKNQQLLICMSDITNRKFIEETIHLQQIKMASIDRLGSINEQIYSISESQNHSLTVIDNYLYGCIRRLETENFNPAELLQTLKKVTEQSRILANIIVQIKDFTSKTALCYELTNINDIIKDVLTLIRYELLEFPITINYESFDNFPTVKLDKLHIQQVILNLIRNSIEAMRDANIPEPKLLIELRLVNKSIIEINVLDNGPGFDSHIIDKLFEPHFTTKQYALGLGLSASRTIVKKHGGQLTVSNNLSGGACFQLQLPCIATSPSLVGDGRGLLSDKVGVLMS